MLQPEGVAQQSVGVQLHQPLAFLHIRFLPVRRNVAKKMQVLMRRLNKNACNRRFHIPAPVLRARSRMAPRMGGIPYCRWRHSLVVGPGRHLPDRPFLSGPLNCLTGFTPRVHFSDHDPRGPCAP
jgi:hypothetical protein